MSFSYLLDAFVDLIPDAVLEAGDNFFYGTSALLTDAADKGYAQFGLGTGLLRAGARLFDFLGDMSVNKESEPPSWDDYWDDMNIVFEGAAEESKSDIAASLSYFALAHEELQFKTTGEYSEMYEIRKAIANDDIDELENALLRAYQSESIVDENGAPEGKDFYEVIWDLHGPSYPMVVLPEDTMPDEMESLLGLETGIEDFGDQNFIGITAVSGFAGGAYEFHKHKGAEHADAVLSVGTKHPAIYLITPAIHAMELTAAVPFMEGEPRSLNWDKFVNVDEDEEQEESEDDVTDPLIPDIDPPPITIPDPDFTKPEIPWTGITLVAFAGLVTLYGFAKAVDMVHQNKQNLPSGWWKFDPSLIEGIHYDAEEEEETSEADAPEENPYKAAYQRENEISPEEANPEAFLVDPAVESEDDETIQEE